MKISDFRNILVVQTAFLGDVVLTTPLFAALKRLCPGASVTLLTTPLAANLVEEDKNLDGIITFDKKGGESFFSIAGKLKKGGYDLMISPHRSHRTSIIGFLSRIPVRVGYGEAGFSIFYTHRVKRPMELHEVDRILHLLTALGAASEPSDRKLTVNYTAAEKAEVDKILEEAGIPPGTRLAGLCPGSVWPTKRWTVEGFAEVGKGLREKGYGVVVVGGPEDRETGARVLGLLGGKAVDAVGKTSLKALAAWIDRFSVFVTNDSGPLHVASARNVPTVAVFGATVRELGFFPFHQRSKVVETALPCRPCGLHGGKTCPEGHFRCMLDITPETVLKACLELTGESP